VTTWSPVTQAGSLTDRIVMQIEQMLADDRLSVGERLPAERELAQLLGVSRPSVREAVRVLQARGRLIVKHGQGVFVAEPQSTQQLRSALGQAELTLSELFAMREVLEVPAAGWAAERVTKADLTALRRDLDELDRQFDSGPPDFERLARLDADFHLGIARAAGNRFLQQTTHVLSDILLSGMQTTLLLPGRREKARSQHERILAALTAKDAAEARRAARAHIRSARDAALSRVSGA
jgi:GntR family transcriptional repressor for pyruvate dehydrogenase complex